MSEFSPIKDPAVAAVFDAYPDDVLPRLMDLRRLILETADSIDGVGPIEETLKWGQPSYLTSQSRSGSTIRIAATNSKPTYEYAMYFICHTNLVENFEAMFGDVFVYDGGRALLFSVADEIPEDELRECVSRALTYHRDKV